MRRIFSSLFIAIATLIPTFSYAGLVSDRVKKIGGTDGVGFQDRSLPELVGTIINAALSLLGVVFLVLLVYGGYKWMMASGNEEEVTKAKDIIWRAIIGLMIVMAAGAITFFVTSRIEKASIQ